MRRLFAPLLLLAPLACAEDLVVNFEGAALFQPGSDLANRLEQWVENGVTFKLARKPQQSQAKGLIMFFEHLSNGHKGIACAMALEPIPVRATLPRPAVSVTVSLWGSTGVPALLEAFDADGKVVDRVSLAAAPGRKKPGEPVPIFDMTVKGANIAYVEFSGPRTGEYLAADEMRVVFAGR